MHLTRGNHEAKNMNKLYGYNSNNKKFQLINYQFNKKKI